MDDITRLQIQVSSNQVGTADARMRSLATNSGRAEKATTGLTKKVLRMAAAYVTVTTATRAFMGVINQVRDFQVLRAGLTTATGDIGTMEKAWQSLVTFAATTPFDLAESVTAYTRMVNYGLRPSERAMKSFGDTASALQYQLGDMVEAVAKATAGEFEPLRKFAITAKKNGEDVTFTFRGVKTTVKNSAEEIQNYFTELGENNFAGAMAERMGTLDGAISNMGDSFDQLKYSIGTSSGVADTFQGVVSDITGYMDELKARIDSGEIPQRMETWGIAFDGFGEGVGTMFTNAGTAVGGFVNAVSTAAGDNGEEVMRFTKDWKGFMDFMFTTPASMTLIASEIMAQVEYIGETIGNVAVQAKRDFEGMLEDFGSYTKFALSDIGAPGIQKPEGATSSLWDDSGNLDLAASARATRAQRDAEENAERAERGRIMAEQAERNLADARDKYQSNWERTIADLEANAAKAGALAEGAGVLPDKGSVEDGLAAAAPDPAGFSVINGTSTKKDKGGSGGGGGAGGTTDFQQLMEQLQGEEQAIAKSYANRVQIIRDNTAEGSSIRAIASLSALDQYEQDVQALIDQDKYRADTMREAFQREEDLIRATYERRKQIILDATGTTEEAKLKMLDDAQKRYADSMKEHNRQQNQVYLDAASNFFGDLSSLSSIESEKMFKISQGAAIANATISMYQSAVNAYASGAMISPYLGPVFAAAALAAGAANIASIKSQTYSGAYEHGGMIPGGKVGLVGEAGPEFVKGPAVVTSARATADRSAGRTSGSYPTVNIINNAPGVVVEQKETSDSEKIEFIVKLVEKRVAGGISSGHSPVAKSMESTYPIKRGIA